MHNLDPPGDATSMSCNGFFHTYASRAAIIDHFETGKIISGYHHPQYPKHVIVEYCRPGKMLGLVVLQTDIGVDKQYESGMYYCKFSEDVPLATHSPRQYTHQNVSVGAIMLPLKNSNEEFQMQYLVKYSDS